MPRLYCPTPLHAGAILDLPAAAARHAQVLRLQPGDALTLFTGDAGEFVAHIVQMGRASVQVRVDAHHAIEREAPCAVHLAVGMPANERMDWLVEKATELGVASIQPLLTERSVLRLTGERAAHKTAHWHRVAIAACEQCGGNQVPLLHPIRSLRDWLSVCCPPSADRVRVLLSLSSTAQQLQQVAGPRHTAVTVLCGPEGGLSLAEETAVLGCSFVSATLGVRTLRSETAALAALAYLLCRGGE